MSAQDYDAWGYILEGRTYESKEGKFKFTGKERDEESFYDYFGARYYDARIANWTSVDPLMEKHYDFSPYNYVLRNPMKLIDPDGQQVNPQDVLNIYSWYISDKVQRDYYNNLSLVGKEEFKRSQPDYSTGRIEATGDEMLIVGIVDLGVNALTRTTTLFRAVTSKELQSIQTLGKYSLVEGVESKYFWTSEQDAKWFVKSMNENVESLKNESFVITKTKVRKKLLKSKYVYKGSDVGHEFYNFGKKTLEKFPKYPRILDYKSGL